MATEANDTDTAVTADAVTITDAEHHQRFEARIGGKLAGLLTYRRTEGRVVYPHTEVEPAFEGRGIGGRLTRAALDDARSRDLSVDPACPFIAAWIAENPEYEELVA